MCSQHKYQPIILIFITLPGIIGLYAGIFRDLVEPAITEESSLEKVSVDSNRERFGFDRDSIYPGFGVFFVINVKHVDRNRRKFIFDSGEITKNRVSLYLDKGDNLVYRILDNESESHIIKIPQQLTTFRAGSTIAVFLDYGFIEGKSFMRILINDRELEEKVFRYPINLPKSLNFGNYRIGCDFSGNNCGNFSSMAFVTWSESFSEKKHQDILNRVMSAFSL